METSGIEGAPAIFSISSSGLLFIVLVLNLIANATKGMAFVKKILRRGVQKAYELQQWNSIRTNLRIIETLQTISLICLLGFGGFMGLHIAGQKQFCKKTYEQLSPKLGSKFSTLPKLFDINSTVQWQNADLKKKIIII